MCHAFLLLLLLLLCFRKMNRMEWWRIFFIVCCAVFREASIERRCTELLVRTRTASGCLILPCLFCVFGRGPEFRCCNMAGGVGGYVMKEKKVR